MRKLIEKLDTLLGNSISYILFAPMKILRSVILFIQLFSDVQGPYGTRSTAALAIKASGEVSFYETYLDKETWKEKTVNYRIQRLKS